MQRVQFKIILRNWRNNKIYTAISLLSLVTGLTCGILLITFVLHEYRIARALPDKERCYIVREQTTYNTIPNNTLMSAEIGPFLKNNYPEIRDYCMFHFESIVLPLHEQEIFCDHGFSVSSNFPDFFDLPLLAGDLRTTLQSPAELAVSRSFARQYLGCENPVGRSITLKRAVPFHDGERYIYRDTEEIYTITSVIDDSQKTFLDIQMLRSIPEECNMQFNGFAYYVFVKMAPRADIPTLLENVNRTKPTGVRGDINFTPIHQLYFSDHPHLADTELIAKRDITFVYISLSVALLLLVVACFNHININLAQSLKQLRTTGIQFICGKSKAGIRTQLITETGILVFFSFCVSLALLHVLIPHFNSFADTNLQFSDLYAGYTSLAIVSLLIVLAVVPSLYVLLKINVSSLSVILKQGYKNRVHLTRNIVIAQFTLSIILFSIVLNIQDQMHFITHYRPFSEEIITLGRDIYNLEDNQRKYFRDRLLSIPEIEAVTSTGTHENMNIVDNGISIGYMDADDTFWDFYGIRLLEGRRIFPGKQAFAEAVVNESFVQKKGWINPLGKQFSLPEGKYTVVGVVQDFPTEKFTKEVEPLLIRYDPNGSGRTVIRIRKGTFPLVREKVATLWHQFSPGTPPPTMSNMAEIYLQYHEDEQRTLQSVSLFTLISLLLTGMGLFGLAWFSVENRRKEICIRKINGAGKQQIILLLSGRFVKWILIALGVALPITLYLSHQWLMQFTYKMHLNAWNYLFASIIVILLGFISVIWQTYRAATESPINTLKKE